VQAGVNPQSPPHRGMAWQGGTAWQGAC
jgi:hypothetical protein